MSSSAFGGWWSAAEMIGLRGREATMLQDLISSASSGAAAQGDVRAGAAPPQEDGASPAAAAPSPSGTGTKDAAEAGDISAGAAASGASPAVGRLSADTAVAILVDCFGHC